MLGLFIHIIIGYLMAFLGLMSPGLLTMTTLNTAIDRGKNEAVKFALGAVVPIFIQAHIALLGAEYLQAHPQIIKDFSKFAVLIFFTISILFFHQYKQRNIKVKTFHFHIQNSFLYGMLVSLFNPLAIPFYFTYSTLLEMQGILVLHEPYISIFVLSAVLGAFSILYIYARHAPRLLSRIGLVAKHFKLILAVIMCVLALASLFNGFR